MSKQQLHELVDRLPESETAAAARYLEFLIANDEAPVDPATLKRIDAARAQNGPGIPHVAWPKAVPDAAGALPSFPSLKEIRTSSGPSVPRKPLG
jgi:hypothetical protein